MNENDQAIQNDNRYPGYFVAGAMLGSLLGALVGAVAMLLMAPQSGVNTRKQLRRKGRDLRVKTADTIEDGVSEVRAKAHQATSGIHDGAEAMQKRGEDLVDHQKVRWTPVVKAGKTAINGS